MKLTKKQREELRNKYDGRCAYCGCVLPDRWHADHLEPVSRNPYTGVQDYPERDHIGNLMPSCPPCNNHKHSFTLEYWRKVLQDLPDNLERNNNTYRHALRFRMVNPVRMPVVFHFERISTINQPSTPHTAI